MLENADTTSDVQKILRRVGDNQYYYKLNDTQNNIFKVIDKSPGIRYRELARQTGFANGVLTYHLNILEQFGYVNKFKHNSITRYYPRSIPNNELRIISHLRVHSERDIILFLLCHDFCTFSEIVQYLRKAPSTVSWHLKRLCEDGILAVHHREYYLYRINDKKLVNQMLNKYKESFTDKVVNNFVDIADKL
jgi:predicted transcriptional regulator